MASNPIETDGGLDPRPNATRERTWVAVGLVGVAVLAWIVLRADPPAAGSQRPGPEVSIAAAPTSGWEPMVSVGASRGEAYPDPMVWRGDRVCVGFGRVDFDVDDRRPSLARCVDRFATRSLDDGELMSLLMVESGPDMWHFVEVDSAVVGVSVELAEGGEVSADRIHVGGSTIGLRLEQGVDVDRIAWETASGTYHCATDPIVWETSIFCETGS